MFSILQPNKRKATNGSLFPAAKKFAMDLWLFVLLMCAWAFVCVKRQRGIFHKEAKKHSIKDKKTSKVDKARQIWERKEKKN